MRRALTSWLLAGVLLACGPSPAAVTAEAPSGTLVVVIKQGPERVPFHPKVARIQRANEQLAAILGHSIAIELDGSLLPQTHEGAEEVIAHLVEDVARDLDDLRKEDAKALAFARSHFTTLAVRYAPAEAAAREERWNRRRMGGKLEVSTKTIDVVRADAGWRALERGEIAIAIGRAFTAGNDARYSRALPDAMPRGELRSWFEYHAHDTRNASRTEDTQRDPSAHLGSIDARRVHGMVILHGLASRANDVALTKDTRAWLIEALSSFSDAYHHHTAEVESAAEGSAFRKAEGAYVGWLRDELPNMSLDERGRLASYLWVTDFRARTGDPFATFAFPRIDRMTFAFEAIDTWIKAGQPTGTTAKYFETVVCPAESETKDGRISFTNHGRCDGTFYRWALANRSREDVLVKGVIARAESRAFVGSFFYNAHRVLREENDYLRFLRRFEGVPALWRVGADVHREGVFRPSEGLLEESRRLWREAPASRAHVLMWFARHAEGSYHPETDWMDMVQGAPADEATLGAHLDLGWEAFQLLPATWPGVARTSGRVRVVTAHAKQLLGGGEGTVRARVPGTLASLGRVLCKDGSMSEAAELRAFAQAELAAFPGVGLSDVIEATAPERCKADPRARGPVGSGNAVKQVKQVKRNGDAAREKHERPSKDVR